MNIDYNLMGSRLCQRRKELHLTQKELAERVNISNNHMSGIENGEKRPSLETLLIICHELGISLDYLFHGVMYTDINSEIIDKIKLCSIEDKETISGIIDVFLKKNRLVK